MILPGAFVNRRIGSRRPTPPRELKRLAEPGLKEFT